MLAALVVVVRTTFLVGVLEDFFLAFERVTGAEKDGDEDDSTTERATSDGSCEIHYTTTRINTN